MQQYISSSDIANTVMMMRSGFDGTVALVEGVTDRRLYGKFMDTENARIVIAHSKDNVRNATRKIYSERKMEKIIGIMDADLDIIERRSPQPPLFLTDTRDSENMMLRSCAYESVMNEYADPDLAERYERTYGDIRENVLRSSYPLGILMYISDRYGLKLSFKDLDFEQFISSRTMGCDLGRMASAVLDNSKSGSTIRPSELVNRINSEKKYDEWSVCRGHDLMSVMAVGLKHIFGGSNCRSMTGNILAGGFRLAFTREAMRSTKLYSDTSQWCAGKGLDLWFRE